MNKSEEIQNLTIRSLKLQKTMLLSEISKEKRSKAVKLWIRVLELLKIKILEYKRDIKIE